MNFSFFKYQGTGNDFILIDDRSGLFPKDKSIVKRLCDRKFGIGSDGLILIQTSVDSDFYMDFYNPDGSKSFCGNGSRCAVAFAYKIGIIEKECVFYAIDGKHSGEILVDRTVKIDLKNVEGVKTINKDLILDTGSPHYVRFVSDLKTEDILKTGKEIRYSNEFSKEGINVNLVEIGEKSILKVATYERGVEDETLSCGTGVTAMALAANFHADIPSPIAVETRGGKLLVTFQGSKGNYTDIHLIGPATFVFKGEIQL